MIRKQFLASLGRIGAAICAAGPATLKSLCAAQERKTGAERLPAGTSDAARTGFRGKRAGTEYAYEVSAAPEAVFPLLCPVREYEWLDGWSCEMIYSDSGVAEENCIFRTKSPVGPMTWNVNRYEPPARIDFVTFVPDHMVTRLTITLEPVGSGRTKLHWKRVFTGLSDAGNQNVGLWPVEREREIGRKLEYFLKTGTMLRGS